MPPQAAYYQPQPYQNADLNRPLGIGQYMGMFILMLIPLVNIIMIFTWAFGGSVNLNKKNMARAILIMALILIALCIAASFLLRPLINDLISEFSYYF